MNDSPEEQTEEDEDDNDIDGFLSSHGFEYIDATVGRPSRASPDDEGEGPFSDGEAQSHLRVNRLFMDALPLRSYTKSPSRS